MQQHNIDFNTVLQQVATFHTHILPYYQTNYGANTVTFAHSASTEQIHIGVNIQSQYGLVVYITLEHKQGQWCVNGTLADMHNPISLLHHMLKRVHIGTIKTLEFLESQRIMKGWQIAYDERNTIKITDRGAECTINILQTNAITDMVITGVFETGTHKTSFSSLDDVKSLIGVTNTLMDTSQNWAASEHVQRPY